MAVFGYLELEKIVQVNDKTRLSAVKSFVSKGDPAISLVRIKPDDSGDFIDVSGSPVNQKDWFLDWQYSSPGDKVVTLEITQTGIPTPEIFTKTITVLSEIQDLLFSNDSDLIAKESDVLKYVPAGRNSFLNVHREAQTQILNWLDEVRIYKKDGSKLSKTDLKPSDDLKQLSANWALAIIYGSISNKPDDVFFQKKLDYMKQVESNKYRGRIQADFNNNGTHEAEDNQDMRSFRLVRR